MGRHKAAKSVELKPWLSGNRECRDGRFIQVGNSLLLSEPFKKLPGNTVKTYLALCMESGGRPTVTLSHAGAAKYGIDDATFDRAISKLKEAGFISCDFDDNPYRYKANVYRFISNWKP